MRKFLTRGIALLALMGASSAQAANYNWNGFYLGGNLGYSWGRSSTDYTLGQVTGGGVAGTGLDAASSSIDLKGMLGGLQLGYNWQRTNWVFGLETDFQWTGQKGSTSFSCVSAALCGFPPAVTTNIDQKLKWFGTARGRIGPTISPTAFVYLTGGLAYGRFDTDLSVAGVAGNGVTPTSTLASFSTTKVGWVIGAGAEGVISGKWTAKIEYLYIDFGTVSGGPITSTTAPAARTNFVTAAFSSRMTDNILRVGLNYKY
jgi:outer membrane immunogenic protein